MSQTTTPEPFGFVELIHAALGDIAEALSVRETTVAGKTARAQSVIALALGLFPSDAMQMMLAGQAVMFHALTADAVRDLLRDTSGFPRSKGRSDAVAMARTVSKNLDTLVKLQDGPSRGWVTPPKEEFAPAGPVSPPPTHEVPITAMEEVASTPSATGASWLDAPYIETVVATPADCAACGIELSPEASMDVALSQRLVEDAPLAMEPAKTNRPAGPEAVPVTDAPRIPERRQDTEAAARASARAEIDGANSNCPEEEEVDRSGVQGRR